MKKMKKTIKTIITLFLGILIIFTIAFLFYFDWILKTPVEKSSGKYQIFEVKSGESTFEIAQSLESKKLIRSDWAFYINAKFKSEVLKTGFYNLSESMSSEDIFTKIVNGQTNIVKVTIPEGYRAEQIAQILDEKNVVKYNDFLARAKKNEGELFPDTYYFHNDMNSSDVVEAMISDFKERTKNIKFTQEDLVIASIVEREAIKDSERPLIAGIYKNRINKKMKLEADPTVQYGKDDLETKDLQSEEKLNFKYWSPITSKDYLTVDSPYNTYMISGLPPKPICNPGVKSIEATVNYEKHNYLYFIQNGGEIYPSETLEGHNKNRRDILGVR